MDAKGAGTKQGRPKRAPETTEQSSARALAKALGKRDPGPIRLAFARAAERARGFFDSLAGRLLALTAAAVLAGEIAIFIPALSSFHNTWLQDRVNIAQTAALALAAAPTETDVADALIDQLLQNAEVKRIAMKRAEERELILDAGGVTGAMRTYDFTIAPPLQRFGWAFETFFARDGRVLRVLAQPRFETGEFIEIVLNEAPLKRAMGEWALSFALISTLILMAAAALMYATLSVVLVRPIRTLTSAIERFRDRPEDVSIAFARSNRADEIGRAERAAADMAEQIRLSLRQRERLAALGAAVARIGHDLRNMLSTAQLVSERLVNSEDPTVRQVAPRLERAIGRAAGLAASTLKYGRADEAAPSMKTINLADVALAAAEDAMAAFPDLSVRIDGPEKLGCNADPDQVHRILVNLMRNSAQAMGGANQGGGGLVLRASRDGRFCFVEIEDHGPGVPERLRERLFEPFVTGGRSNGGTGLGLAIARELARAMGGDVTLARSDSKGAVFLVTLLAS